jgi:hypothetical protein
MHVDSGQRRAGQKSSNISRSVAVRDRPTSAGIANREVRSGSRGGLVVLIALGVAVLGVLLSLRVLAPAGHHAGAKSFGIGDDVPTSFGIVAVEFVRSVDGVSHRALAGANHGVSGYVEAGQQQIQVAVAVTNRGSTPMNYTVRDFQLRATIKGKTTILRATSGDLPNGRILPSAGIEGHLDFTLPAANAVASLVFHDGGAKAPVVIDLGTIAATAPTAPHSHG